MLVFGCFGGGVREGTSEKEGLMMLEKAGETYTPANSKAITTPLSLT